MWVGSSEYRFKSCIYLHSMTHIVQYCVVDGLPDVPHRTLHVGWSDDLMSPWCVLVCCQDANLSPGDLLLMDVHRLIKTKDKNKTKDWQQGPDPSLWFDYMLVIKHSCTSSILTLFLLRYTLRKMNYGECYSSSQGFWRHDLTCQTVGPWTHAGYKTVSVTCCWCEISVVMLRAVCSSKCRTRKGSSAVWFTAVSAPCWARHPPGVLKGACEEVKHFWP